jgi:hypothetical protein
MDWNNPSPENRNSRDLIVMLVTKLDNIEKLVHDVKLEGKRDTEELAKRFAERYVEIIAEINELKSQVQDLKDDNDHKFVSKDVFQPVKAIVYGIAGTSLMGIMYALLKLISIK